MKAWKDGEDISGKADRLSRSIKNSSMSGRIPSISLLMESEVTRQGVQGMKMKNMQVLIPIKMAE